MKRCLHILPMNKMSGAEKMALLICSNLKEYEPIVVCGGDELRDRFNKMNVSSYSLSFKKIDLFITLYKLKFLIKANNIKIIHCHDNMASLCGYILKNVYRLNIKIISHIHSCYPWLLTDNKYKKIDKVIRKKYDYNIACGKQVYDLYKNNTDYFIEERFEILSNAIDLNEEKKVLPENDMKIAKKFNIDTNKTIFGFVGRLENEKGLVEFIEALSNYKEKFKECIFLIVGSGSMEYELKKLVLDKGLNNLFIFTGYQEEVYEFYSLIDIFFLSSLYEGLPMVILEAMSLSKPIVSTNVGSISEVIKNNYNGILVNKNEYNQLIKKLYELKEQQEFREFIGKNAYYTIHENYSINKYINRLEAIYNEIAQY